MINLNFNISNPWSYRWTILWNKSKLLTRHKAIEFNGYRTSDFITLDFQFKPTGDHSGIRAMIGLVGFEVELHFYDTRHWDYETDSFIH